MESVLEVVLAGSISVHMNLNSMRVHVSEQPELNKTMKKGKIKLVRLSTI